MAARSLALIFLALTLRAEQFDLQTPAGEIRVVSVVAINDNNRPHLVAVATNLSDAPIRTVRLCFHLDADPAECSFVYSRKLFWKPGKNITIDELSSSRVSTTAHTVAIESIGQRHVAQNIEK